MARPSTMPVVVQVAPYSGGPYGEGPAGVHGVLGQAVEGLGELARLQGLEPTAVRDVSELGPDELDRAAVLALFTIGETPFTPEQRRHISSNWRDGRLGVLGVHSATDACHTWDDYGRLLGARFDGHPWTVDFTADVVDGAHAATAHLGKRWQWHDEVYLFRKLRPDARVLLQVGEGQLDMSAPDARRPVHGFPLCWCHVEGGGRTFYTALGHFSAAWENPVYLRHLSGGLSWLLE